MLPISVPADVKRHDASMRRSHLLLYRGERDKENVSQLGNHHTLFCRMQSFVQRLKHLSAEPKFLRLWRIPVKRHSQVHVFDQSGEAAEATVKALPSPFSCNRLRAEFLSRTLDNHMQISRWSLHLTDLHRQPRFGIRQNCLKAYAINQLLHICNQIIQTSCRGLSESWRRWRRKRAAASRLICALPCDQFLSITCTT